jgi:hypothetical protein
MIPPLSCLCHCVDIVYDYIYSRIFQNVLNQKLAYIFLVCFIYVLKTLFTFYHSFKYNVLSINDILIWCYHLFSSCNNYNVSVEHMGKVVDLIAVIKGL